MAETNNLPFIYYITDEQGQHLGVPVFSGVPWGSQRGQPEHTMWTMKGHVSWATTFFQKKKKIGLRVQ